MHAGSVVFVESQETASCNPCEFNPQMFLHSVLHLFDQHGKRKILSLQRRVDVLRRLDSGVSCRAIANDIGCGKTQICRIHSEREAVMREWETGGRSDLKYVKKRKTIYDELNLLVCEWFCAARNKELPVSGRRLIQVCHHLHFPCPSFELRFQMQYFVKHKYTWEC